MTAATGTSKCVRATFTCAPCAHQSGVVMTLSKRAITFLFGVALVCVLSLPAQNNSSDINSPLGPIEILIRQNRLDEARAKTMDELQHNPSSVDAYNMLGMIAVEQQDFASAAASFQKALKLQPGSTRAHNNLGSLYVAEK